MRFTLVKNRSTSETNPFVNIVITADRTVHETYQTRHVELPTKESQGRQSWTMLHSYRGCDPAWVKIWEDSIPSGGCSCKEGYKAILKDHPFDYSSPDAFFASGIALHNAVNRKLEKPEITLDEARQIWNRTDSQTQECCNGEKCNNAGEKCCRERA
jgi:hypothetical protein